MEKGLIFRSMPLVGVCVLLIDKMVSLPIIITDITVILLALWAVIGLIKYWKRF